MRKFLIKFIVINILLTVNLKASYYIGLPSEFKSSEITYPQLIDPSHRNVYDTLQSALDNISIPSDILNVSRSGGSSDKNLIFFSSLDIYKGRFPTATIDVKINSVNIDVRNSIYRCIFYCRSNCNIENIKGSFIENRSTYPYRGLVNIAGSNSRVVDMEVLFDSNLVTSSLLYNAGEIKRIKGNFIENEYANAMHMTTDVIANSGYIGYLKGNFLNNIDCSILNNGGTMNVTGGFIGNKYSFCSNNLIENGVEKLTINDSIFSNNIVEAEFNGSYALIENYGILVFNDSKFSGNYVRITVPEGYEIYCSGVLGNCGQHSTIEFNLSAGKKINNAGNYFEVNGKKENEFGGFLYMGRLEAHNGVANFNIDKNASYIIGDGRSGYDSIASSDQSHIINKNGKGELVVNSSMEFYTGTLNVNEGNMTVNNKLGASAVRIASGASLSAKVNGNGSTFTNAALNYSNDGTLNLVAGETLASGNYEVFVFENPETVYFGNVKSYGGTFDHATGTFVVNDALNITIGETNSVNVKSNGRILAVGAGAEDTSIMMNFNSAADVTVNSVFDTSASDDGFAEIVGAVNQEDLLLAEAFAFDVENLGSGDTVSLSFFIGSGYDISQFTVYHKDAELGWELADITNLEYDGEYLSFIVDGFSSYGYVAAVPEPSTYATIIGAISLCLILSCRRK